MAFISVNSLKNDILKSWDNDTHRGYAASRVHNQVHQNLMLIVERQPTADVVPAAKFDHSQMLLANAYKRIKELEKAKSEVVREIFEEIERLLELNSLQGDIFTGKYFDVDLKDDISELKKKYTEGE